jgi:N4-bis(aminopropyl)spermidine synthase
MAIDFRKALNTISDVVQNRPTPLREFDQIYMKVGDLVIQADFIARKFDKLNLVSIGDGDAICLSIMHLKQQEVFNYGPKHITVLDFDERIVNSINDFARKNDLADKIDAELYNVCDPVPVKHRRVSDAFYTNPPWGASNDGQSVNAFVKRGIESTKPKGIGAIVIADNVEYSWTSHVIFETQKHLISSGYIVSEMIPCLHQYHLDDAPELASCCIVVREVETLACFDNSEALPQLLLQNFYGRENPLIYRYVKDLSGLNTGRASDGSYELISMK